MIRKKAHIVCLFPLCRGVEHIFDEDAIAGGWVIDKDMGDGADEFAVLYNRRAGHADVK